MRIAEIRQCESDTGFALPVAGVTPAPGDESKNTRPAFFSLAAESERCVLAHFAINTAGAGAAAPAAEARNPRRVSHFRLALVLIPACLLAACAPAIHLDAPAMPALDTQPIATQCTKEPVKTIAPLDAPLQLPDAKQSPCPPGSGLAACFTPDQDAIRQRRFKILHDDRDYCRDAYDRAVTRSGGGGLK